MTKILDIDGYDNNDYSLLCIAITTYDDQLLLEILDSNIDLDVRFKSKKYPVNYTPSPLMEAVRFNNANAVRLIGKKLKAQGTLDLSQEAYSKPLLHHAIRGGNPDIVRYLISFGVDVNLSSKEDTPLTSSIRVLPTYSLIQYGEWDTGADKKQLLDWYNGKGEFPQTATAVKWRGNLNILKQILEAGADCTVHDICNNTPIEVMNTLTSPEHIKNRVFCTDNGAAVEFVSAGKDDITFNITLLNRDETHRHPVTVTYNVCDVRALLEQYKEKNKHKGVDSKKLKELEASVEDCKRKADRHESDLSHVRAERKVVQEKNSILDIIYKYEGLKGFYVNADELIFHNTQVVCGLRTGKLKREHYAKADMVADGISAVGGAVPVFGHGAKAVGAVVQKGSDINEKRNHKRFRKNLPETKEVQAWANSITIELTKHFGAELIKLNAERAEEFAEKVAEVVYDTLIEKEYEDNSKQKTGVKQILINAVKKSDAVNQKLDSLLNAQTRDDKKHQETLARQKQEAQKAKAIAAKRQQEKAQLAQYAQYRAANGKELDAEDVQVLEDAAQKKECSIM